MSIHSPQKLKKVSFGLDELLLMMPRVLVKMEIVLEQLHDSHHSYYFKNLILFLSFDYAQTCYSKSRTIYKNDEMKL